MKYDFFASGCSGNLSVPVGYLNILELFRPKWLCFILKLINQPIPSRFLNIFIEQILSSPLMGIQEFTIYIYILCSKISFQNPIFQIGRLFWNRGILYYPYNSIEGCIMRMFGSPRLRFPPNYQFWVFSVEGRQ